MSDRVDLKYVSIDNLSLEEAVENIYKTSSALDAKYVVTPNADHVLRLEKDTFFQKIYSKADLILADGVTIVFLARRMGVKLKQRVCGSDIMPALCEKVAGGDRSVFILGGPPGAGDIAAERLKKKYPGLNITGVYSPKYGFEDDKLELEHINSMLNTIKPNIVFVGLGSPKQEAWIYNHGRHLEVGVLLAIGAAIEFEAGTVKRAPKIMRKLGLEWITGQRFLKRHSKLFRLSTRKTYRFYIYFIFRRVWFYWLNSSFDNLLNYNY